MAATEQIDVRRAAERFVTRTDWLVSSHSFSFGHHYDPANVGHGLLLVNNDDIVVPGAGFDTHAHQDMEILTWVLRGSLVHQDSTGHREVIHPGLAQRMSAGTGILHSERNASERTGGEAEGAVHFVQMWVVPDEKGLVPGYEQRDVTDELKAGGFVTVASGIAKHADETAIGINARNAAMHVARLQPGGLVILPEAPYLHLFVAQGDLDLEGTGRLEQGDAVRFTSTGGQQVTATGHSAEIIVWEMHAS